MPEISLFERLCPVNNSNNSALNNFEIPAEKDNNIKNSNSFEQNNKEKQQFLPSSSISKYSCREDVINEILKQKILLNLKWTEIAKIIGCSKEWTTAACLGQMQFNEIEAEKMVYF